MHTNLIESPPHRNILKQNVQGEPDAVHSKAGVSELGRRKLHEELLQVGKPNMVVALRTLIAFMAGIVLKTFMSMTLIILKNLLIFKFNSYYDPQKAKTTTSATASSVQQL